MAQADKNSEQLYQTQIWYPPDFNGEPTEEGLEGPDAVLQHLLDFDALRPEGRGQALSFNDLLFLRTKMEKNVPTGLHS